MLELKYGPKLLEAPPPSNEGDLGKMLEVVYLFAVRRYKMIVLLGIVGLLAGLTYLKFERPSYTAAAVISVANREGRYLQEQATLADLPTNLERDIAFAKSVTVADGVTRKLRLDNDPEFGQASSDFLLRLRSLWSGNPVDPQNQQLRTAVSAVVARTRVTADNSGSSLVIAFTSYSPGKAVEIANAIADAFIGSQNEAETEVHKQATAWLVAQSDELAKRAKEAATAVAEFIKKNDIVLVDGKPVDQQKLEDIDKRVVEAREKVTDAQIRSNRIEASVQAVATRELLDATSQPDVLQDPAIAKSRDRYLDLSNQIRSIQHDFGKDSQKLQELMAFTRAEILAELARLRDNARNDYQLAQKHYDELLDDQKAAVEASHRAVYLEDQLKELQGTAQNYRTLYENFLQHSAESVQELSFPVRSARISERATPPFDKSWPKPIVVLAIATLGGLGLGVGVSAAREFADGGLRTGRQLESAVGVRCLGLIPRTSVPLNALATLGFPRELAERFERMRRLPIWLKVGIAPNSRFVSELVAVRLALRSCAVSQGSRVFGFTSAVPGEGKSSLVAALGALTVQSAQRVALIDLDFRNRTLTNLFGANNRFGLTDVLSGDLALEDIAFRVPGFDLTVFPCSASGNLKLIVDLLTSPKIIDCVNDLRQEYDLIFIDLPPLIPVADVRATTEYIDTYILVAEWARTGVSIIRRALESCPEIEGKLLGGIINKVDFKTLKYYDATSHSYSMRSEFARYFDRE